MERFFRVWYIKRARTLIPYLLILMSAILGVCVVFLPRKHIIVIDERISNVTAAAIHAQCAMSWGTAHFNSVLQKFPCTYSWASRHTPNGSAQVTFFAHNPMFFLNHEWTLTSSGVIVPSSDYQADLISQLVPIVISSHSEKTPINEHTRQWILSVPQMVWKAYRMYAQTEHEIYFMVHGDERICIRSGVHEPCDEQWVSRLTRAHAYMKEYMETMEKAGITKRLIVDIRFDKQLILCEEPRGIHYGKAIT